jgi:ABC-type phosphate transport system substrate-binding protein
MARRLLILALLLGFLASPGAAGEPARIAVIAHPSRRVELSADLVNQIYLRRKRFWDDGSAIVPLNLPAGTALRETFTRSVLGQSEARLAEYWNRQYFYGVLPPATLASTRAMLRYVASDPSAIGYVPAAEIDDSVRVVLRLE